MNVLTLVHAGLEVYQRPKSGNKWHLPVCSALKRAELFRLSPNHITCWEEVDFDGCPTMCYVMTGKLVKQLNNLRNFNSFFSIFSDCLGKGPAREFFHDLWIKYNNSKAISRNKWERAHGVHVCASSYRSPSIRNSARLSIV